MGGRISSRHDVGTLNSSRHSVSNSKEMRSGGKALPAIQQLSLPSIHAIGDNFYATSGLQRIQSSLQMIEEFWKRQKMSGGNFYEKYSTGFCTYETY